MKLANLKCSKIGDGHYSFSYLGGVSQKEEGISYVQLPEAYSS